MRHLLFLAALQLGASEPALLLLSYNDDLHSAGQLILAHARVNEANDLGATPLWAACQNGSIDMVRLLLAAGANPNVALLSGETPLMVAARGGYTEIVRLLLAKRADPNRTATRRQTALMWAVAQKHPDVVKLLLANGANIHARSEEWSQVMAVPPHGYRPYNKAIPHGSDTPLLFAARVGDVESAKLLIDAGANVNDADAWGVTATVYAAHSGYRDILELLLANNADPNLAAAGFTALHVAILRRDEKMALDLLAKGANPNTPLTTWTPTRRSSKDLHFDPALVGATPFWLAARFQQPNVMRELVKYGADPKFVHESHTVTGGLFEKRTERITAAQAAKGSPETVKVALELQ
jgi:ankyrin repeat protein